MGAEQEEVLHILALVEGCHLVVGEDDPFRAVCEDKADASLYQVKVLLALLLDAIILPWYIRLRRGHALPTQSIQVHKFVSWYFASHPAVHAIRILSSGCNPHCRREGMRGSTRRSRS